VNFLHYVIFKRKLQYLVKKANKFHCFSGPGCSSIGGGAFTELGPFYPNGDGRGLRRNSMSWNKGMKHAYIVVQSLNLDNVT